MKVAVLLLTAACGSQPSSMAPTAGPTLASIELARDAGRFAL